MLRPPMYIALPGMKVYLTQCFFHSLTDRPRRFHSHPAYELVCIKKDSGVFFQITPPLMEHLAVDALPENVCSLLFTFTQSGQNDICQILKDIKTQVTIADDFDGRIRINNIKKLAETFWEPGTTEHLQAELRLLFICLAKKAGTGENGSAPHAQTLDESRLAVLEEYFNIGLKDPDCTKAQLASALGVSERQLTRILEEVYHSTYSEILLRSRMSIAYAMAAEGHRKPEEIAAAVGYRSAEALRRAYRTYFGVPLKIQNRT